MIKAISPDFSYKTVTGQIRNEKTKICFIGFQFCEPDTKNCNKVAYIKDSNAIVIRVPG